MNCKRFLLSVVAVFIVIFIIDFIVHGFVLQGIYSETATLWRPQAEQKMGFMVLSQFAFAVVFSFIYIKAYVAKNIATGLRHGVYIGLLLATLQIGAYAYMPIPFVLALAWCCSVIINSVVAGWVIGCIYKS
ncbi:hypothetical protein [Piscirickettsia litoralis]|uniref:Uncharacterized protein n=1 Tax=Piscirickettsia litoralis TaxID=1891921 RepID=A0ABX3A0V1_9GAMM|nr:hypothetical protein [Piscirickettsia litoralis]ODN42433.1 hypothetical protein BGC07_05150 [Piscirickettsia litoralis]